MRVKKSELTIKKSELTIKKADLLYKNFEHRMDFFWKSYYRLMLYHFAIPVLPILLLKYLPSNILNLDSSEYQLFFLFIVLIIIITALGVFALPTTIEYLVGEDNRILRVHSQYKKLLRNIDIDIDIFSNEESDKKKIKTGTIMIRKFALLVLLFSGFIYEIMFFATSKPLLLIFKDMKSLYLYNNLGLMSFVTFILATVLGFIYNSIKKKIEKNSCRYVNDPSKTDG
jgi:hypothetical protein